MNRVPYEARKAKFGEGDWHPLRVTFAIKEECDDNMRKHLKGKTLKEQLWAWHTWFGDEAKVGGGTGLIVERCIGV